MSYPTPPHAVGHRRYGAGALGSPLLAAPWRRISKPNHPITPAQSIKFAIFLVVIASSSMAAHTLAATIQIIPRINQVAALNGNNNRISTSGPATVTITGGDRQSQANASTLTRRDADTANQSLKNTLTLQDTARLQESLKTAQQNQQAAQLVGAVLDHVIGDVAAQNGWAEGSTQKVLLHGLSGAIQAGVAGGSLTAGVAAGAANEALIPLMTDYLKAQGVSEFVRDAQGNTVLNPQFAELLKIGSTLVGAAAGAVAGGGAGGGAGNVALGASVGLTGTTENYLNHVRPSMLRLSEKERYDAATASCETGDQAACGTRNELANLSRDRDQQLAQACSGSSPDLCNSLAKDAAAMGNVVYGNQGGLVYANSPAPSALNTSAIGPITRSENFHDEVARSTAEGLLLESGNQVIGALIGVAAKGAVATSNAVREVFTSQGILVDQAVVARITNNFGRDGDQFTVFADQLVQAERSGWVTAEGRTWWPPGNGAVPGTQTSATLQVGQRLDRYGGTTTRSSFLAPTNISLEQRALSPTTNTALHDEYIVLKPIPVEQSNVAPWFGKPGMGVQYDTNKGIGMSIQKLVEKGYLQKVGP